MIHCDVRTCVGCRTCEVACSSVHFGAVAPALSRIRVAKLEELGLDMAVACLSCLEKPCLECPTAGLSVGAQGAIVLNVELCNACGVCVEVCPIGAVGFYDSRPLFCDLCDGAISCVKVCPSQALSCPETPEEISLQAYLPSTGNPGERRARLALARGAPVRESWKNGARVAL